MRILIVAGCLFFGLVALADKKVNGVISSQGDTVHFELSGQQNWDYDVKRLDVKGQPVVEMTVPALDDSTIQSLQTFKSDFVKGVTVNKNGTDGKSVIQFAISGEDIETFDYLTDQPSRLIMDFYVNPNMKAKASAKSASKKKEQPSGVEESKIVKSEEKIKTEKQRKPATADFLSAGDQGLPVAKNEGAVKTGIFDGGDPDYDRFSVKDYEIKEAAMIRAKDNYYIPFPMLEAPLTYWEQLKVSPTLYEVLPKQTDENKQARLLLTLFEKQRYAVFLKTRQWFKEKYPSSEYNEMIDFMTADVYLSMYQGQGRPQDLDEAIQKYKEAITKYPQSPLAEKTSLKIGYLSLDRGDALGALRLFNEHLENKKFPNKKSLSMDLARLGTGLAFTKLNRWKDAISQFDELEKTASNRDIKVEAAFRRGDVATRAKDYNGAVAYYAKALKTYPEAQNFYPNAYYNQAESMFWMKDYSKSLEAYKTFVKKFPSNEHSAFAMTRLGELLEIFGADPSRVMGAYLETYFRFGEAPSAVIARLRLLSARMKGMKPKEVNSAVTEIMSLAKKIDLPNIEQFATVMVAEGYSRRNENQKSIDLLSKYFKEHPNTVDEKLVRNRIVANINDQLQNEVEAGKFIEALKTHSKYSDNWLKNSARLDTKYNVGRAFEMGGVPVEAEKYYKDVLNRTYAIRGTQEAKEIQVKEQVPSEDELNLRLASIYTQENKYNQAYENLKNIKAPEKLNEGAQIERVNIAVKLLEKRGDTDSAIRYLGELLRTWKGQPELVAEPYLKLAELQLKQNRVAETIQALEMVDKLQVDSGKVAPAVHAKSLEMLGEIYNNKGPTEKAIASYNQLLEKYEETRPLSSIRYKLGQIYFKQGEIQKAADVWNEFKGEKSGFWRNLAQEQLKNSEWRDGYKKYIKRIPAMSENGQGQ